MSVNPLQASTSHMVIVNGEINFGSLPLVVPNYLFGGFSGEPMLFHFGFEKQRNKTDPFLEYPYRFENSLIEIEMNTLIKEG